MNNLEGPFMPNDIPNLTKAVNNNEKRNSIIRVVHNRENPYVQLNKQALWDDSLSLKAIGLWARCMSRPDDWTFCISELVKKCKEGRRAVDSAMQELIEHGYAYRMEVDVKGKDGKFTHRMVEYVFFEFPATQEEKVNQFEIFKKFHRDCGFGNLRDGNLRNDELLIKSNTKKEVTKDISTSSSEVPSEQAPVVAVEILISSPEEVPRKTKAPPDFSPEVKELASKIVTNLHNANPDWIIPKNLHAIMLQIEEMITKDNRTPKRIFDVFMWALCDSFWMDKLCKPNPVKYLRQQFGQFTGQMKALPSKKNEVDRRLKEKDGSAVDEYKDLMF